MKSLTCKSASLGTWIVIIIAILVAISSQAQSTFRVDIRGKGQPMILIPGLTCSGEVWNETVKHYEKNYQCHVITLAGFGKNEPINREKFLSAVKDDVIAYVGSKNLDRPVIMGHSLGGFLALWIAAEAPGKFNRIISVDGYPFMTAAMMPGATEESAKPMARNMTNGMAEQSIEQFAERTRTSLTTMISAPEKIDEVMVTAKYSDPKTQAQAIYELMTTDLRTKISSIDCPVMIMGTWIAYKGYGQTHDGAVAGLKSQTSALKSVTIEVTDTALHFIFLDDPQWFFSKTDTFLKG